MQTLACYVQTNSNKGRTLFVINFIDFFLQPSGDFLFVIKSINYGPLMLININYCAWLNFCEVPIFVILVEGPILKFQYPGNSYFLYELLRKMLWP